MTTLTFLLPSRAEAARVKVLVLDSRKGNLGAQFKSIMSNIMPIIGKKAGDELVLEFLTEKKGFWAKVGDPSVTYIHTNDSEFLPKIKSMGFSPLVGIRLFNSQDDGLCLFVNKKTKAASVKDLMGKKATGYINPSAYYQITKFLGKTPDTFFSSYLPSRSGQDALFGLSLNQSDVAVSTKSNISYLKAANPGPLGKIKQVACFNIPNPIMPVFARTSYPKKKRDAMAQYLKNFTRDPQLKRYESLFKLLQLAFVTPDLKLYQSAENIMAEGRKRGWDKAHARWHLQTIGAPW